MRINELLLKLAELQVNIKVEGNNLRIKGEDEVLTGDLIREIKAKKEEIINYYKRFAAVKNVEKKEYYPLSSAQKRMFLIQQMDKDSTRFNLTSQFTISKDVGSEKLEAVFKKLIKRHETLRTSFFMLNGNPVQIIYQEPHFGLEFSRQGKNESREIYGEFVRPFDLFTVPLFRVGLIEREDNNILIVDMHHIISDGISHAILEREFVSLLQGADLPQVKLQYKDYSGWQNSEEHGETLKNQEAFWLSRLPGELPVLNLPGDFPRPLMLEYEGNSISFWFDEKESQDLEMLNRKFGSTLFISLLTIYNVLLAKLSGQEDIMVGSPAAARSHSDLDEVIGMFVNILCMRNYPADDKTFVEFLYEVKQNTLNAYENQDYQFDELVERVSARRDADRNPLIDVVFVLQNQTDYNKETLKYTEEFVYGSTGLAPYDLNLLCIEMGQRLFFNFDYRTRLFKPGTIKRWIRYFKKIMLTVVGNPGIKLSEIDILTEAEKNHLVNELNDTAVELPAEKLIHRFFEAQVEETPGRAAVVFEDKAITYRELNNRSNQLARSLREEGIKPNVIVGIMISPSLEMITAIIGVLKAGGGYLPIDPNYPEKRVAYMLADSSTAVLLAEERLSGKVEFHGKRLFIHGPGMFSGDKTNLNNVNIPADTVYVIYTSGTTGQPKGILIAHLSLTNLIITNKKNYQLKEKEIMLQPFSFCFDPSVEILFLALNFGCELVLIRKETLLDMDLAGDYLLNHHITHVHTVPQVLNNIRFKSMDQVNRIVTGGELFPVTLVQRFIKDCDFYNAYGPTEATITASLAHIKRTDEEVNSINIGSPIANIEIYILNNNLQCQPVGIAGEIFIGGVGVGKGYLNRPQLTAEKFITAQALSFKPQAQTFGIRPQQGFHMSHMSYKSYLYKTGDLGRWLPDGSIEFIGRLDYQLKIRGHRVELGEIESQLLRLQGVKEALVIDKTDKSGQRYLCGYIVPAEKPGTAGTPAQEFDLAAIKEKLAQNVQAYMVPSYFVAIDKIPLTPNGKVNRRALPEPEVISGDEYVAPANEIEEILCRVWSEVLGIESVGTQLDFFEAGGDSIKAIQISSRLQNYGLKVSIRDLFRYPRIMEISGYVKSGEPAQERGAVEGEIPLTPIQQWFFEMDFSDSFHFNQAVMLYKKDGFDGKILSTLFSKLAEHHDVLRIIYKKGAGQVVQFNRGIKGSYYDLEVYDFSKAQDVKPLIEEKVQQIQGSINLQQGPLLKCGLFKTKAGDHLLIVIHHLVVDGVSWRIILEDLRRGYEQAVKGEPIGFQDKTASFKTWSMVQQKYAASPQLLRELSYWREIEETEVTALPVDRDIEENDRVEGNQRFIPVVFDEEMTANLLRESGRAFNTEINDLLLTALLLAVTEWAGTDEVLVNLEGHGREEIGESPDISRTVGWFTSQYPVILRTADMADLTHTIKEVKETLRRIPNKGIGYGILKYLTAADKKQEFEFKKKAEICFNYLGEFVGETADNAIFSISSMSPGSSQSEKMESIYKLNINGMAAGGSLSLNFIYNRYEYEEETVKRLCSCYEKYLKEITAFCSSRDKVEKTPSDYGYMRLSLQELAAINEHTKQINMKPEIRDIYPLSPMQGGMFFHSLHSPGSSMYLEQFGFSLQGELDEEILEKSFNIIISRYNILRTLFLSKGLSEPAQVVLSERPLKINHIDISDLAKEEQEKYIADFRKRDRQDRFNLSTDHLFRVSLIKKSKDYHNLIWSHHHILMDGWCSTVIYGELLYVYHALKEGKEVDLGEAAQYRVYIDWLEQQDKDEGLRYWSNYLKGYDNKSIVPGIYKEGAAQAKEESYQHRAIDIVLDENYTAELKRKAAENKITVNTIIQAAWGILLHKYNNSSDAVYGALVAGRALDIEKIEELVGLFINTIPIRVKADPAMNFLELAADMQRQAGESSRYEYLPLAEIQSLTENKIELIDHIMGFEDFPISDRLRESTKKFAAGLKISTMDTYEQTNYDFSLGIYPGDKLKVKFVYNGSRCRSSAVAAVALHYQNILRTVTKEFAIDISGIEILSTDDKNRLLHSFNDTEREYPREKTVHRLFEQQVEKTPDNTALIFKDHSMTYKKLNVDANRLAGLLRERKVGPESLVALLQERSPEMIVQILAILKSGGGYLPIEPDYPEERVLHILNDAGVNTVLTGKNMVNNFSFSGLQGLKDDSRLPYLSDKRQQIKDFDSIPFPDRSLIDYEKINQYIGQTMAKNRISLQATRGCPYKCAYCHKIWPKTHVRRSTENILSEIKIYYDMGVRKFAFLDDVFNLDIKNSRRFFELIIKNKLDVLLFFPNGMRADILTKDYIDLMVEAGVVNLGMALETASPRLQRLIRKNLNLDKLRENLEYLCSTYPQVIIDLFSMHGFPTESKEEARMTLNFIKSIKWLHFPYVFILRIFPNTDMMELALENNISLDSIIKSQKLAYHHLPETLPFEKSFTLKYQSEFLNEYFLNRDRLLHVLPYQMRILSEDEMVQKYNSYLPVEINHFSQLLDFIKIGREELESSPVLNNESYVKPDEMAVPCLNKKIRAYFPVNKPAKGALKVLLLDLSYYFSKDKTLLVDMVEAPTGLMYLLTYLNHRQGDRVDGRIALPRLDFDSYEEFKELLFDFKPDIIGVRSLTFFKDFLHKTIAKIRHWGIDVPVIAGGPYATACYPSLLQDPNIDVAVLGEGEITFNEIITRVIENGGRLPGDDVLKTIPGIAFIPQRKHINLCRDVVIYDDIKDRILHHSKDNLTYTGQPQNMGYVIYTSGSTGNPKGVIVKHSNFVNSVFSQKREFKIDQCEKILQFSSISFDASIEQIWLALLSGAALVLISKEILLDKIGFARYIKERVVTHINTVPAFWEEMDVKDKEQFKRVVMGGDICSPGLAKNWYRQCDLYNAYGTTETTITSIEYLVKSIGKDQSPLPIGKPIDNTTVYILDKYIQPVPPGITGELYIGGAGLGRGYLNRPELTKEKFVDFASGGHQGGFFVKPPPWTPRKTFVDEQGRRGEPCVRPSGKASVGARRAVPTGLYKSGDLCRWLPDGNIEFAGRVDYQVKVRGFRIELGEIENQLLRINGVKEAVVIDREDKAGLKYLCGYIVTEKIRRSSGSEEEEIGIKEIREKLAENLQEYMIPAHFVKLEQIPLAANGKVNRRTLPQPNVVAVDDYTAPANETEEKMCRVWSEVLGTEAIGVHTNFFETGGDSIKAIQISSRLRKHGLKVSISDLFKYPRIAELSRHVKIQERKIDQGPVEGDIPLTPVQQGFFKTGYTDSHHFNHSVMLYIKEGIAGDKLKQVLTKIVEHHDVLRAVFKQEGERVVQFNRGPGENCYHLSAYDLCKEPDVKAAIEKKAQQIQASINLQQGPLLKCGLFKTSAGDHLLIVIHHLLVDGISWRIILEDLWRGYEQASRGQDISFQARTDSFSFWSKELRRYAESPRLLKESAYWREVEDTVLQPLPVDFSIEENKRKVGNERHVSLVFDNEVTSTLLTESNSAYNTEINDLLLTALLLAVKKWTGLQEIPVSLEGHGREDIGIDVDISRTVGWFTAQYPVLLRARDAADLPRTISEVKEDLRRVPNKGIGYGILRYLTPAGKKPGLEFQKEAEICFNYLGEFAGDTVDNSIFSISPMPMGDSASREMESIYKININSMVTGGRLSMNFSYNKHEYREETIKQLCSYYELCLKDIIAHCSAKDKVEMTPSDFGREELSIEEFESIFK